MTILAGPPRRRWYPPRRVTFSVSVLTGALAVFSLVLTLTSRPAPAPVPVQVCGHVYQVRAGQVLRITGFGTHCSAVVTGG
jgi:hypothetical protein